MTNQTQTETRETFEQLENFKEIKAPTINVGDHVRYTVEKYGVPDTRKCVYCVVKKISKDRQAFRVSGYKGDPAESWVLDLQNKFKNFRFYKKILQERVIQWS
jgi:hypothetical protein